MPTTIAHGLLGANIVALFHPNPTKRNSLPLLIGGFMANVSDFDFILVLLLSSKEWHRGFTHSILFAGIFLLTAIICGAKFNKPREGIAYGLACASHFILDFVTTKVGDGLELFWFFNSERHLLGWFGMSENPSKLSTFEIANWVVLEMLIFIPTLSLIYFVRRKNKC